ncbi:MAG: PCI domain-containing protein [Candidatus Lokiarchaeota archaeon]|nr:PCI domain-containing protein [Candidatus Lokiarchaeota archaeon]
MASPNCASCATPLSKNDFQCATCGKGYCRIHVLTNEKYKCQKCGASHVRETAFKFNGTCPTIPQSSCPKCAGTLRLDKLPAGQHYLRCGKCGWNSFDAQPMICYQADTIVLKEATKLGLARQPKACEGKLKKNQGEDFCPNCLLAKLKSSGTISFSTIGGLVKMDEDEIPRLLDSLVKDYNLGGIIDEQNKLFTYIDPGLKARVSEQVKTSGYVSVDAIAKNINVSLEQALKLMYEIIRNERLRGTFSRQKKFYYATTFIQNKLVAQAGSQGEIDIDNFCTAQDVHAEIVKDILVTLLKTRDIDGFFAANGNKIYTKTRLMDLVYNYAEQHKKFRLETIAEELGVAIELIRSMLHELVKQGRMRGVFTQKREYVTDVALKDEIGQIVTAYRTIALDELARRLGITEKTVEESLASLIARGDISGYIDLRTREFKLDVVKPPSAPAVPRSPGMQGGPGSASQASSTGMPAPGHDEKYVEVVREYDFVGGQVHFKIATRNNSPAAIYDVKVVIDYPDAFQIEDEMISIPVIEPNSSRGVDFYLEPTSCGKSQVGATVIYKDYTATPHTIHVEKKEVWIKCPLVVATMDNLNDVMLVIQSLPSDARSFLISDIDARLAYHAGFRAISHFDARCVAAPEKMDGDMFEADAYFATKVKTGGGRIVIKLSVSEKSQIMEIRVWCAEAGQLTGLLAKIIEYLFQEINTIRKIKAESREKTIDLMAIAQGITVLSDYVMLQWKNGDVSNKLEDLFARLTRVLKTDEMLDEMKAWLDKLREQDEEANMSKEISDQLAPVVEKWQEAIKRKVAPE